MRSNGSDHLKSDQTHEVLRDFNESVSPSERSKVRDLCGGPLRPYAGPDDPSDVLKQLTASGPGDVEFSRLFREGWNGMRMRLNRSDWGTEIGPVDFG